MFYIAGENPENFIKFEEKDKLSHDSLVDDYIEQNEVIKFQMILLDNLVEKCQFVEN